MKVMIYEASVKRINEGREPIPKSKTEVKSVPLSAIVKAASTVKIIDIMVVWTDESEIFFGGRAQAKSKIAAAFAQFNTALINSGITDFRTRLVWSGKVDYATSGASNDLNAITSGLPISAGQGIDGTNTNQIRDRVGADFVQLASMITDYCGLGYIFPPGAGLGFDSYAFSVAQPGCYGQYSHIHEVGHNLGLSHNVETGDPAYWGGYSFGKQWCVTDGYRTILAYSCTSGVATNRVLVFSSSTQYYINRVSGTTGEDNARAIEASSVFTPNFRASRYTVCRANMTPEQRRRCR